MPRGKDKKNYTMFNETLYEVEDVLQIKWIKNRQFCYIKWKGYDEKFNTWEPKEHITFCYDYVAPQEPIEDSSQKDNSEVPTLVNHHQYQTRGKIRPPKHAYQKLLEFTTPKEDQDKSEDLPAVAQKPKPTEKGLNEVQIQGSAEKETNSKTYKDRLINKIVELSQEEGTCKRIGRVQLQNGAMAFMYEDKLKAHYPQKVIEYYEHQFRSKSQKSQKKQ